MFSIHSHAQSSGTLADGKKTLPPVKTLREVTVTYNFGGNIKKQKTSAGAEEEKKRTTVSEN